MLRISKKADYAVFLLGEIARQGAFPGGRAESDAVVSAHEIARLARLNKSVVANLLKEFARQGLLQSTRGLKGGYRLTRAPDAVSLGEILEIVDGPFHLVDCIRDAGASAAGGSNATGGDTTGGDATGGDATGGDATDHQCNLIDFCPTKNPMRIVHERIERLFDDITLAEMSGLNGCTHADAIPDFSAPKFSAPKLQ